MGLRNIIFDTAVALDWASALRNVAGLASGYEEVVWVKDLDDATAISKNGYGVIGKEDGGYLVVVSKK